jgi:hypothetical protein
MCKLKRLSWIPAALCLSACDVQVNDTTPAQFEANNDVGMYEITATASEGALVSPGSLVLFAIGDSQKVQLSPNSDGSGWHGLYSVRCQSSFPLQILAVWRLQGLATRNVLVPPQPHQVKLSEPPLSKQEGFDTAAKPQEAPKGKGGKAGKAGKGEWEGTVNYRFATVPVTQITAARIEPSSASAEDAAAARAISVKTPLPLQSACGENAQLHLVSHEQRAHGTLVIDTDNPGVPRWQTYVEFSPK